MTVVPFPSVILSLSKDHFSPRVQPHRRVGKLNFLKQNQMKFYRFLQPLKVRLDFSRL